MQSTTPTPSYTVISGPAWSVPSNSAKNLTYTVTVDQATGLYVCGCKDHEFRRRDCRHIKQVQAGTAGKPRVRVCPKPAPRTVPTFSLDDLGGSDAGASVSAAVAAWRRAS